MQYHSIFITIKDVEDANKIGRALVEEKLVACVNMHPIKSTYWWEGEIQEEEEIAMLAKTKAELVDTVIQRVKELHPYEVPCIVSSPIAKSYPDFLNWISDSTK